MSRTNLGRFLKQLHSSCSPLVFNPWTDLDPATDLSPQAPRERIARLVAHLSVKPRYILIGEAAGYQGCKVSGIPFTSERLILAGQIPRVRVPGPRLTSRPRPWSEPSATTIWNTLFALGLAQEVILWNAFPWHPHKPGILHSNRTPKPDERASGLPVLASLLEHFPRAQVFAVGRNAEWALQQMDCRATPLRHPSMGGATKFAQQLRAAVRQAR